MNPWQKHNRKMPAARNSTPLRRSMRQGLDHVPHIMYKDSQAKERAMNSVTVPLSHDAANKLDRLARLTKQNPGDIVAQALDDFLATQAWQIDRSPDAFDANQDIPAERDEAALAKGLDLALEDE
jgi:hypothetical protein